MTTATPIRTDEEIQRDVLEELKWDPRVQLNEIDISVKDAVVTLTGWADTYVKAMAAERAAHRVRGVKAVVNDIEVRLPSSAERTDADIAAEAIRALKWDVQIPTEKLNVTVSNGWVTLRGEVDWDYQRRAAERAVSRLGGVRGVTNLMTVRPWTTPSVEELKRKIKEALIRNAEVDADRIDVYVNDGTATLTGTVRALFEKEVAGLTAWLAPGITSVNNRIIVRPHDD